MFIIRHLFGRLLLALALAAMSLQASAGPIYQVSIDTSSLGSGPAFLGLYFLSLEGAAPATATVSGLSGAFDGVAQSTGSVNGTAPGPLYFSNAGGGGEWVQGITLGGLLRFDVEFAFQPGSDGSTFGWALFDNSQYLGAAGDLGTLAIAPDAGTITLTQSGSIGQVALVPEPSSAALMLLACVALATLRRRRR